MARCALAIASMEEGTAMSDRKGDPEHKRPREEKIDQAVEETFPASDPPSNTPAPGSRKAEQIEQKPGKGS